MNTSITITDAVLLHPNSRGKKLKKLKLNKNIFDT